MDMARKSKLTVLLVAGAYVADAGQAHAYIDPGTGSILLQGIVGGAATGLVLIRFYGAKAKQKVVGLFRRDDPDTSAPSSASE